MFEIILECSVTSFPSQSHFQRSFKKLYGFTPQAYRKSIN
ncbi:MAG TPA: helix-turn-helix transcriptional regulator [Clostridiales bacterium]|nr:helix-turn-helix transcriptional regulator [Clostridiales bacterium]